jgi:hypothetical protein
MPRYAVRHQAAAPRSASEASQERSPHTLCEEPPPSTRPRAAWTGFACLAKARLSGLHSSQRLHVARTPARAAPRRTNRHPTLPPLRPTHAPPHLRQNPPPILGLPRLPQRQRHPRYRSLGPTAHHRRSNRPVRRPHLRGFFLTPHPDPPEKPPSLKTMLLS